MPASAAPPYSVVAAGGQHVCALQTDNELECAAPSFSLRLLPPDNLGTFDAISAGGSHTCGIKTDGSVVCWGENSFGQLDVPALSLPVTNLDAGENHTCAIDVNGTITCWGLDSNSRTVIPQAVIDQATGQAFTAVSTRNNYSCALDIASTPLCWTAQTGFRNTQPPAGLTGVQQVEAFSDQTDSVNLACAIDSAGEIQCWGERFARVIEAGNLPVFQNAPYVDIAITDDLICAVAQSGVLDCQTHQSTRNATRALAAVPSGSNFVAIDDGNFGLFCALDSGGDASCWNRNGAIRYLEFLQLQSGLLDTPTDFRASVYSSSFLELFWGGQLLTNGQFEIYRNDELLVVTDNESSYADSDLQTDAEYRYRIRSVLPDGRVSEFTDTLVVNLADFTNAGPAVGYQPPSRVNETTGLRVEVYWETTVELFWDRKNSSVVGYEVRRDGAYIGFTDGVSFFDPDVPPGDQPHYDVIAIGRDGEILGFAGVDVQIGLGECR